MLDTRCYILPILDLDLDISKVYSWYSNWESRGLVTHLLWPYDVVMPNFSLLARLYCVTPADLAPHTPPPFPQKTKIRTYGAAGYETRATLSCDLNPPFNSMQLTLIGSTNPWLKSILELSLWQDYMNAERTSRVVYLVVTYVLWDTCVMKFVDENWIWRVLFIS